MNIKLSNRYKYIILFISFITFINFILPIQYKIVLSNPNKTTKNITSLYSITISYKGKKIMKSKLLDNYLSGISDIYKYEKDLEKERFNKYYYLCDYSTDPAIKNELKSNILRFISKKKNKNVTNLDIFYLKKALHFGNNIMALSNTIFFCEVVGCHKIILNKKKLKLSWLITKPIYIKKSNITISLGKNIDCNKNNILCLYEISWCIYYPKFIIPELRTEQIKQEILRNLPKVNVSQNDLFIHIRGGDIFKSSIGRNYAQPPLCYYERVLNNTTFKNVYIISMDHSNVVLDALVKRYKNIIYKKNNLNYDISLLCHAFNLVVSASSFAFSAIKLNNNLKILWEFDMIRLSNKFLFHHHHIFKFKMKYKIYSMKPSETYRKKMFAFKRSKMQLKLMLEDKCTYDFVLFQ